MKIRDAFQIPRTTDLDTFITRLDTSDPSRVRQDLASFVMVDSVFQQVDRMLGATHDRFQQNQDIGRFIHGTFGCGKSHLLAVLAKMLESDELVYEVGDPRLRELRGRHGWMDRKNLLVVRLNMMGKPGVVRALFDAYHAALPDDTPPVVLTDHERVFELMELDQRRMGEEAFFRQLVTEKVIPSRGFYETQRGGSTQQQLSLAARLLAWRDNDDSVRPESLWVADQEGFSRIAQHARELGYDGIVWMIDELIIWIRGKTSGDYIKEINALSAMVDHDGARDLPFLTLLAVQQDIAQTCPEDLSDSDFHHQLGFINDRFKPFITMAEQDLYEVTSRRVLKPQPENKDGLASRLETSFKKHAVAIKTLAGDLDEHTVRRLYPFHPALIRVLVDVTQCLSRSRTAMAALYALLEQYQELDVGQFIPVGALYPIVFDRQSVASVRDTRSRLTELYVEAADTNERLTGKIEDVGGSRAAELHQLVRTVLMCQLSRKTYYPDGRSLAESVTASALLRMNLSDVKAVTERTGLSHIVRMFRSLASADLQVQVTGDGADPRIEIKTEPVDSEGLLRAALADVTHQDRFAACRAALDGELGLRLGAVNETRRKITWRGTKRMVRIHLCNVRRLSSSGRENQFQPASDEEVLVLVDYPFDEDPTCGRNDDITAMQNARKRGAQWTVGWLPEHFSDVENKVLSNVAAVRRIRKDKPRYLSEYAPKVAQSLLRSLESFLSNQETQLRQALRRVYMAQGQLHVMDARLNGLTLAQQDPQRVIETVSTETLSRRYPRHPRFKRLVTARDLSLAAGSIVQAAVSDAPVQVSTREQDLLDSYGVPLELVHPGQGTVTAKRDGRYLSAIKGWIGDRKVVEASELHRFLSDDADKDSYGLTTEVVQFLVWYLLNAEGYALEKKSNQASLTVERLTGIRLDEVRLRKAEVVPLTVWEHARSVADRLLGLRDTADHVTVPEQSRLARAIGREADRVARGVQGLIAATETACAQVGVTPDESMRLTAYRALDERLRAWATPGPDTERLRDVATLHGSPLLQEWLAVTGTLAEERAALREVDGSLLAFQHVSRLGDDQQKQQVVTALQNLLKDPAERRLADHATDWAKKAREEAERLVVRPDRDAATWEQATGEAGSAEVVRAALNGLLEKLAPGEYVYELRLRRKDG